MLLSSSSLANAEVFNCILFVGGGVLPVLGKKQNRGQKI